MAVNSRGEVRRAIDLLDQQWYRDHLTGFNAKGERVIVTADLDTSFREVLHAIDLGGGMGNIIVMRDDRVLALVVESADMTTVAPTRRRQPIEEDATVGMVFDACRSAVDSEGTVFTITRHGTERGILVTGFQREYVAA